MSESVNDPARWAQLNERLAEFERRLLDGFAIDPEERTARLRERSLEWAREIGDQAPSDEFEALRFGISGELYAIASEYVALVMPLSQYTPLPNTPAYVLGIVNVRGRIVSVLDLRVLFELPIDSLSERNFLLILQSPEMEFGVLIDRVLGIAQIRRDALQKAPANLSGVRANYLLGVTAEQATVLDGARLLSDPDLPVMAE
ncbi:MAG TPA: chemotaxis protein CheW [Pseudomonas sp.]|uniref:chemotaxis protein CheW n=1 Tax=Pseudomonas sp. TaxID=306 RepID=UPI002BC0052F|nr:chemotaxis protein CheW [Pseudomonas sp.]HSX91094.1 chemotaxis protein CheW [Pseudomonas sp.]